MVRSQFAISVHIMTLLTSSDPEYVSSMFIAGSLNMNAVLVRKELSNLRNHGLVECREGKGGGCRLTRNAADIKLSDIFKAINEEHVFGYAKNEPNPKCQVGRQIKNKLDLLFGEIDYEIASKLANKSLLDFYNNFD